MLRKIIFGLMTIFVACLAGDAIARGKDRPQCIRCDKPNAIDYQMFGMGTPIGFTGLLYQHHLDGYRTVEVGVGAGASGQNETLNLLNHFSKFRGSYTLLGASYSHGHPEVVRETVQEDGRVEEVRSGVPDALWFNAGIGTRIEWQNGMRMSFEIGLTYVAMSGIFHRAELDRAHGHGFIIVPEQGSFLPNFTLLRLGYGF